MIYYFRDHLGKGTAPLADIDSAIKSGTLSDQTLVSLDGETWQSVEAAQKPPALPPQHVPAPVQYIQVEPANKKKTGCVAWGLLILAGLWMVGFIAEEMAKPSANDAKDRLSSVVRGTAIAAVKARLKDGKGAEFDMQSIGWHQRKDGAYEITGEVRATNSFGAMLNNRWRIVMRENADAGSWDILYAKIGGTEQGVYPPDAP